MSIDIILQYCVYCDYPLFRAWLQKYRSKFQKVVLFPSRQHGTCDLEDFSKEVIKETWVEPTPIQYGVEDWRQAETDQCLRLSKDSEWILFMEQDFFMADWDRLFKDVEKAVANGSEMIGVWNPTHFPYMHPCFLLIKRELLYKTNQDFSAHPDINGCDHFAMLTRDVERLGAKITTLEDMGYVEWEDYFHLGGLTYPFQNWKGDGTDHFGVKSPEAYYVYLYHTNKLNVEQSPEYLKQAQEIQDTLQKKFPDLNLEDNKWVKFYQM